MIRLLLILILVFFLYNQWSQQRGEQLNDGFVEYQGPGPIANPYSGGGSGGGGSITDRVNNFVQQVKQDIADFRQNMSEGIARGIERLRNLGH